MANKKIHELSTVSGTLYALADTGTVTGKAYISKAAGTFVIAPQDYTGFADYICSGSDDQVLINQVISGLGNGTIIFAKGQYSLSAAILVASGITIRGNGSTFVRSGTGNAFSVIGTSSNRISNINVEDVTITGPSTSAAKVAGNGIQTDYADFVTIKNCIITNFGSNGDDGGIALRRSSQIKVLNSWLYNNLNGAICGAATATYPDVTGYTAKDCTANNNWSDGFHAQQSTQIIWQGNNAYNNGESGLDSLGCSNVTVVGNVSTNNQHSGIEFGNTTATGNADTNISILGNVCVGNTLDGIQILGNTDYPVIVGNTCKSNLVDGIQLAGNSGKEVRRAIITNNVLISNTRDGIRITNNNSDHTVKTNTIYDNGGRGVLVTAGTGTTISSVAITDNRFSGNVSNAVDVSGAGTVTGVIQKDNIGNTGDTKEQTRVTFYAPGTASAWTSMPAALTEFRGQTATRQKANLAGKTQFRITLRTTGTAGATGSVIGVQYSTDESTWNFLDDGSVTAGTNAAAITSTNTTVTTAWTNLATNAKGDVTLRVVGQNGDGVISPTLGNIALELQ